MNGPRANGLRVNRQGGWPWGNRSGGKRPGDDEQCGEWPVCKLHGGKWSRDDWSSLGVNNLGEGGRGAVAKGQTV